ncbi:MAG: tetratricopeptide repeat protein [Candidatus Electrothrix sp. GW3-4]|uniref:tetratricopeptide repeat protein n=1 Tax=Candidatus Electrothrix sp. GW3-4 TaxID=3126740 RepID=UPI0030CC77BD
MNCDDLFIEADKAYDEGDYVKAFELFNKAARMGDDSSMSRIALMYYSGDGVDVDIETSIEWDKKAVEAGSFTSLLNLAVTYRALGDIKKAKYWFEKSLAAGNGEAALQLAKLYMVSDKEVETVRKYLRIAIEHDNMYEESVDEAKLLLVTLSDL